MTQNGQNLLQRIIGKRMISKNIYLIHKFQNQNLNTLIIDMVNINLVNKYKFNLKKRKITELSVNGIKYTHQFIIIKEKLMRKGFQMAKELKLEKINYLLATEISQ